MKSCLTGLVPGEGSRPKQDDRLKKTAKERTWTKLNRRVRAHFREMQFREEVLIAYRQEQQKKQDEVE